MLGAYTIAHLCSILRPQANDLPSSLVVHGRRALNQKASLLLSLRSSPVTQHDIAAASRSATIPTCLVRLLRQHHASKRCWSSSFWTMLSLLAAKGGGAIATSTAWASTDPQSGLLLVVYYGLLEYIMVYYSIIPWLSTVDLRSRSIEVPALSAKSPMCRGSK